MNSKNSASFTHRLIRPIRPLLSYTSFIHHLIRPLLSLTNFLAWSFLSLALVLLAPIFSKAQPAYPPAPANPGNISSVEWFIDKDPGIGNGTIKTITPGTDIANLTATIPLSSTPPGIHQLFIRSKDLAGNWSITAATTFENLHPDYAAAPPALAPIGQLEIFFDNDPGFGNGSIQTITPGTDITNLALTLTIDTLPKGPHQLFVRVPGNTPSLSSIASFSNNIPLPLTWLYIKGEIIDGQSHIEWATAQESNTKNFEVQHSLDGNTFTTIGTTPAAGNSTTISTYAWTHTTPSIGANYYRVKEIDLDNRSDHSKVLPLFYSPSLIRTTATPNPFTNSLTVALATPANSTTITIINTTGQSMLKMALPDGTHQQTIDLTSLPAGIYFLQLQSRTQHEMLRVIKK